MHLFQPINGLIDIVQSLKYGAKVKLRCDYDVTDVTEACLARPDVYVYDPDHWSPSFPTIPCLLQLSEATRTKYLKEVIMLEVPCNLARDLHDSVMGMLDILNPDAVIHVRV